MNLTEIFVNDNPIDNEYMAQAFFEWNGVEYEMTVRAPSKEDAEAEAKKRAAEYLAEWAKDQVAANEKYGVYPF